MRILIVDTFYKALPGAPLLRWESPAEVLGGSAQGSLPGRNGTGDAYSYGLKLLGVEAIEIVANSIPLQRAWAMEHSPELLQLEDEGQQLLAILEAQIRWFKATILYVQDINWLPAGYTACEANQLEMVVGQNACPLAINLDLSPYDLLLTSLPHYVGKFRYMGIKAAYFPIGFDERLLQRHSSSESRTHALTFVGGLGAITAREHKCWNPLPSELPLRVWGYGGQQLPERLTFETPDGTEKPGQKICITY